MALDAAEHCRAVRRALSEKQRTTGDDGRTTEGDGRRVFLEMVRRPLEVGVSLTWEGGTDTGPCKTGPLRTFKSLKRETC